MCAQALRYEKHDVCQAHQSDGFTGFPGSWRMLGNETGEVGHDYVLPQVVTEGTGMDGNAKRNIRKEEEVVGGGKKIEPK